ncbi:MAG: hypothetical protein B6I34_03250 [Anaerolineaceae bacterium 4572_32.1]|nr:MAG: hypothetical protein B6I34_03250 [Anaerolineaceae bacterium 4572_32.1]
MAKVGYWTLVLALAGSIYAAVVAALGAQRRRPKMVAGARNLILAVGGLVTVAVIALFYLLLTQDFGIEYVFEHVTSYQPILYNISAFWAGLEGSQLLWLWLLSIFAVAVALHRQTWDSALRPYALAVLAATQALLAALLVFVSDPFAPTPTLQSEGFGLNPLLQNPFMVIHPPIVFIGYAASAVPFAYAIAALITGRLDRAWLRGIRSWNLVSWIFLGMGIILGGWWAYLELGWGGYWSWDPVENAVAIPWLVATAGLHSVLIQERRKMFKTWTIALLVLTFELCLLATFITRSGVIQSVHAFGKSTIGYYYLGFIFVSLALTVGLMYWRRRQLQSKRELESAFSRETGFYLVNLLFGGAALAILLGTFYSPLSELFRDAPVALGAVFYNKVFGPIALAILLLMGFCVATGWRLGSAAKLWRAMRIPAAVSAGATVALIIAGIREPIVLLALFLASFAGMTTLFEFYRDFVVRRNTSALRRYGAYIVHLSVVLIVAGIVGSSFYKTERQVVLEQGESVMVKGYELVYEGADFEVTQEKQRNAATLAVYRDGRLLDRLTPESNFHWNIQQRVSEVDIHYSLIEDLYAVLAGLEEEGALGIFQVFVNPLVNWIWLGGVLMILGTAVALWPSTATTRPEKVNREAELERRVAALRRRAKVAAAAGNCPQCGHSYDKGDLFCVRCGASLSRACPKCGHSYDEGDLFCSKCGQKLQRI